METTQPLPDRSAYPALSDDAITYDEFLRRNTATGTLKVQASRARGALPTPGVRISVIGRFTDARVLFFDGVTDGDGIIEGIILPAAHWRSTRVSTPSSPSPCSCSRR